MLRVSGIRKSYGDCTILDTISFALGPGQKVGLVGPNGSGKSSLLHLLVGQLQPSCGNLTRRAGLKVSYLPQEQESLPAKETVLEYILRCLSEKVDLDSNGNSLVGESQIRTFLHRFLFKRDDVFKKIEQLSYGERTKLLLASLMIGNPDLLILDEPTNHLDIASIECLETVLEQYRGPLLVVSHDRCFLNELNLEISWSIDGGVLRVN